MSEYLNLQGLHGALSNLKLYYDLKAEYGASGDLKKITDELNSVIGEYTEKIKNTAIDKELQAKEPDDLDAIKALRCAGPRKIWQKLPDDIEDKMAGALLGRFAGCILGVPVELNPIDTMAKLAVDTGTPFPPTQYWNHVYNESGLQYGTSPRVNYTKGGMKTAGVDDDITYTLLGLLMLEKYGLNLTTADIGQTWLDILPMACTAEDIALKNLKKGVSAYETADIDNPYVQWIGADIRSDPWGYAAAGYPEKAAELAYRDAYLSHRRNGIYGEMYFSAVIAAAFTVKTAEEALRIGLTEIPKECSLYGDITWALDNAKDIHNYREARSAVDKKFGGMHSVHTNNNACLVVFGLLMHDGDFTKTIAEVVAMGLDNDCTGATAGSIMGILVGKKGIDPAWYENFNDTVESYITGYPTFKISDVIKRFIAVADKNYQ